MKKLTTLNVLMSLSLLAAAWECWTICNSEDGDTFSATIRKLGTNQPVIVLFSGLVMGHLFWPLIDGEKVVVIEDKK